MRKYLPLLFVLFPFAGCKEKEPEVSKLSVYVRYEYTKLDGSTFTPLDGGATVLLFPNVNISTSKYRYDGKESVTDGTHTIKYFRKGTVDLLNGAVFDAVPYGTHGIVAISKGLNGKWISTSLRINQPTQREEITVDQ